MMIRTKLGTSIVQYNTITGEFHWWCCYRKPWRDGEIATHIMPNGYLYIKANSKQHSASRLAWNLVNGHIPIGLEIDHINRNKQDNRIINLRTATRIENLANSIRPIGLSGHVGVSIWNRPSGNGFLYRARKGNKTTYHQSLEEAIAGYAKLGSEACDK